MGSRICPGEHQQIHIYIYIYIYIDMYKYIYTYIYIHMYIYVSKKRTLQIGGCRYVFFWNHPKIGIIRMFVSGNVRANSFEGLALTRLRRPIFLTKTSCLTPPVWQGSESLTQRLAQEKLNPPAQAGAEQVRRKNQLGPSQKDRDGRLISCRPVEHHEFPWQIDQHTKHIRAVLGKQVKTGFWA